MTGGLRAETKTKKATVNVVFPIPGGGPYTYRLPEDYPRPPAPGVRVAASLGRRLLTGVVTESGVRPPARVRLKYVTEVIDDVPLVPPELIELARWMARYYLCDLGEALRAVVPGIFLRVGDRKVRLTEAGIPLLNNFSALQKKLLCLLEDQPGGWMLQSRLCSRLKTRSLAGPLAELAEAGVVETTDHLPLLPRARSRTMVKAAEEVSAEEAGRLLARTPRQHECLEYLKGTSAPVELSLLLRVGFSSALVGALAQKGLVDKYEVYDPRDPFRNVSFPDYHPPEPSPVQREVIASLGGALAGHGVHLLYGVTGSGKTLVYLELLKPVLEAGRQAIVLVPEIALTPQTVGRFRAVFGPRVALLHSGLSEGERYDIWRQIAEGRYLVVVGPRSAVFAPFHNLGIIVIDEEHEHTYKQDTTPRYHAREVAIRRMEIFGGPVLLGSATPSLESFRKAELGTYTLHRLPERVRGLPLPAVRVTDLRRGWSTGRKSLVTDSLVSATGFAIEAGGQVLMLLNRRGFHSYLLCEECGEVVGCPLCRISLTLHRRLGRLVCHYCGHQRPVSGSCPACESPRMTALGAGTEQVEALLKEKFPGRRVDRMDLDTTGGRWSHHEILERLRTGETDILVGTQMIAKGLDFPNVRLVGVVNADTAMNLPDFRSAERTFCLLAQVAGRTGRGEHGGEVVIQTFRPDHPAVRAAIRHDYQAFARQELAVRKEAQYPPYVELLNVIFSGRDEKKLERFACESADRIQQWVHGQYGESPPLVVGPAPCPLERLRGWWRWHLIVKSALPDEIGRVGGWIASHVKPSARSGQRVVLDRDPASLM